MDKTNHLNHKCISWIEVEVKIEVIIEAGLELIINIEVAWGIIKILGVDWHTVPITEVDMGTIHEAIRGIQEITIMEETVMKIKIIVEDGVGHLKERIEVGEIIEVWVTVGLGQVLEWVQIETEFNALSVESMIILHENVQLG